MLITDPPGIDPTQLRDSMEGRVSAPGDLDWDQARQAWNLAVDQRPAAVAIPESADDVVAIVNFARERGLQVTAQGTGHNAGAYETLANTILVKTHALRGVDIDVEQRIARCAAGTLWVEVSQPASEHGLAPLAGSSPDVGVVGYVLGGGLSWLARKHGLAANNVRAIELVTADGEQVRATAEDHSELFWALRGGGGNYGIVTAVEIELFEYPTVYAGMMLWPWERGAEVLKAWVEWTRTAPDEVSTSARLLQVPPLPDIPEFLAGRAFVAIDGAYLGDDESAAELFAPLRALEPEMDSFGPMAPGGLSFIHMDPEGPTPGMGHHTMLGALDDEAIDTLVKVAGPGSGTPLLMTELRQLGGAVARSGADHGAVDVMAGEFALMCVGIPMTPEVGEALRAALPATIGAMAKWDAGTAYMNFAEASDVDPASFYAAGTYARLKRVKAEVDPAGLFRGNHAISAD
jgi:FAD/FMN-containing dehydrogenase